MKSKPSWLHEHTITLPDGKTVLWSYDSEGDILEIFFEQAPATATIEIADGIFLRFDREQKRPLSIGFISATPMLQQQEYGLPLVKLQGLRNLPAEDRQSVLSMLHSSPLNAILQVYSYKSSPRRQSVPMAVVTQAVPLAA